MSNIEHYSATSPFDAIRRVDEHGEHWSGRDMQPLLGYESWRRFEDAIERARISCKSAGHDPVKVIKGGRWGEQKVVDVRLTRFASYLTAMNGDVKKAEVARAQEYFAVKTREAEVAARPALPQTYAEALRELAASVEEREQLAVKVAELTPAAESWQHLVNAEGDHDLRDAAHMLSRIPGVEIGQRRLADLLRRIEWVDPKTLRPYQKHIKAGRMVSKMSDWTHPDTGITYSRSQPRITPKGMGELHDRLLADLRTSSNGQGSLL